jgi:hypothetical protein
MAQWTLDGDTAARRVWLDGNHSSESTYQLEIDTTDADRWLVLQNTTAIGSGKRRLEPTNAPLSDRRTLQVVTWSVEGTDPLLLRRVLLAWEHWCKQSSPPLGPTPRDWVDRFGATTTRG